ncbi:adenosine 5'-monophosphoramidase HINT3 isoform X2 [Saimiri boliviensis]|uniref:adenosine 5'-monophosphoramidase HINT3 isoform X2 n=1 Tax=Saimiri boliviensis TaxID=27679 RepID=UPI003D7797E8
MADEQVNGSAGLAPDFTAPETTECTASSVGTCEAAATSPEPKDYDSTCVFCRIAGRQDPGTELLHCENEDLVCFKDIKPAATHHYLVVPKKHIGNCRSLGKDQVELETRSCFFAQAGLKLLGSSDLPASASQSFGIWEYKVENMVTVGKTILERNNFTDFTNVRLEGSGVIMAHCSLSLPNYHILLP